MKTCCLISTYNSAQTIARCLESCTEFDRVIVWDDGSTDETMAIVSRYPGIELIGARHVGLLQARHQLYLASEGADVIAYLDHDDYRLPGMLSPHLAELDRQNADVLVAAMLTLPNKFLSVVTDILAAIVGVRFQTGSLLLRRQAVHRLFQTFGHTWRDIYWFYEGGFAWDLFRAGATFAYDARPGSVYVSRWSDSQFSSQLSHADRLASLHAIAAEMKEWLGDRWIYESLYLSQVAAIDYAMSIRRSS